MPVPITTGIEQVLLKARHDPDFRAALVERRSAAAQDAGLELTPNERAILDSVEAALLGSLIANVPAVVPQPESPVLVAGIRPGLPPDPVRGTRPGLPVALAAGAVLAGGALAVGVWATSGSGPDAPPPPPVVTPAAPAPAPSPAARPNIDSADGARRLARAIASDIRLYHEQEARLAQGGAIPPALQAAIDEGRTLFLQKTAPSIPDREALFREAIEQVLLAP